MSRLIDAARRVGNLEGQFVEWVIAQAPGLEKNVATPILSRGRYGLCLQASKAHQAREEVMRIPMELWGPQSSHFALEKAKREAPSFHQELSRLDEAHGGKLAGPIALATHLAMALVEPKDINHIYCNLLYEGSVNSPSHPLLLSPATLSSLFQASPLVHAMAARRLLYTRIHERLFPPGNGIPLSLLLWAISRVLSRAISGHSRPLTLVPYFDMINHSNTPNCEYEFDSPKGDIVLRALRPMPPTEEITISYGPEKDNHKLMSLYGFVDEENATSIKLHIPSQGASGWIQAKLALDSSNDQSRRMEFLNKINNKGDGLQTSGTTFKKQTLQPADWLIGGNGEPLIEESLVKTLASYMVLVCGSGRNLADLLPKDSGLEGAQLAQSIITRASADVWNDAIHATMSLNLQAQESKYTSTLEEDESTLEDVIHQHQQQCSTASDAEKTKKNALHRSALCLLIEEKRLLRKTVQLLKDYGVKRGEKGI